MWKGPSPGPSSGFVFLRRLCTKTEKEGFVALFQKQERGHNLSTLPTKRGPGPNTISCQRDAAEQDQQDLLTSLAEAARAEDSSTPQKSNETGGEGDGLSSLGSGRPAREPLRPAHRMHQTCVDRRTDGEKRRSLQRQLGGLRRIECHKLSSQDKRTSHATEHGASRGQAH